MDFEWDELKNESNLEKHGVSFEEAQHIFKTPVLTLFDTRSDEYGELREISIGTIDETVVIVVVHTDREGVTRLISARPANKKERNTYYDYLQKAFN